MTPFPWNLESCKLNMGQWRSDLFFVFSLQQIIDLDEKNQILTSNVWLDLTWKDAYMMWNISDYNNITVRNNHRYNHIHIQTRTLGSHRVISGDRTSSSTTALMRTLNLPTPVILLSNIMEKLVGFPQDCSNQLAKSTSPGFPLISRVVI